MEVLGYTYENEFYFNISRSLNDISSRYILYTLNPFSSISTLLDLLKDFSFFSQYSDSLLTANVSGLAIKIQLRLTFGFNSKVNYYSSVLLGLLKPV